MTALGLKRLPVLAEGKVLRVNLSPAETLIALTGQKIFTISSALRNPVCLVSGSIAARREIRVFAARHIRITPVSVCEFSVRKRAILLFLGWFPASIVKTRGLPVVRRELRLVVLSLSYVRPVNTSVFKFSIVSNGVSKGKTARSLSSFAMLLSLVSALMYSGSQGKAIRFLRSPVV